MRPLAKSSSIPAVLLLAASAVFLSGFDTAPFGTPVQAEVKYRSIGKSHGKAKRYVYSRSVLHGPSVKTYKVPKKLPAIGAYRSNGVYLDTAHSKKALRHYDGQMANRRSGTQYRSIRVTGGRKGRHDGVKGRGPYIGSDFGLRGDLYAGHRPDRNGYIRIRRPNGPLIISRSGNSHVDNSVNITNEYSGNFTGDIAIVTAPSGGLTEIAGSTVTTKSSPVCKYGTYCTVDLGGPKIITFNDYGDISADELK